MATGPEHFLLAQSSLLTALIDGIPAQDVTKLQLDGIGHAILALAAALGTYGTDESRTSDDTAEWERVAGEYTRQSARRKAAEAHERAEEQAARDAEAAGPTVADMRQIFGEPVEGRDYHVMPSRDAESGS